MAIYEYRIRRKNDEGNYDILHVESDAALILRYDDEGAENGTVESALRNLESQVNTMSGSTMGTKADKVSGATSGNFAGLDANGNLTDSGKKAADFAAASHNHAASAINSGTLSSDRLPTVPVSKGGTGLTTLTSGSFLKGNGTSAVTLRTPAQVLSDIGAAPSSHNHDTVYSKLDHTHTYEDVGAAPASHTHDYAASSHNHSATNITSGTLSVARGGTGKASWTAYRLVYPSSSTALTQLAFPTTAGSFLRQGTSGAPYWSTPAETLSAIGAAASSHNHDGTYAPASHTHEYAASSHNHSASNITSGTLGTARGGTGITSNPSMLVNLASTTADTVFEASPRPGVTGTLPLGNGGTGGTTALTARSNLGAVNVSYATSSPASSQNTGDLWFETIS